MTKIYYAKKRDFKGTRALLLFAFSREITVISRTRRRLSREIRYTIQREKNGTENEEKIYVTREQKKKTEKRPLQ